MKNKHQAALDAAFLPNMRNMDSGNTIKPLYAKVLAIRRDDTYADKVGAELARVLDLTPVYDDGFDTNYPTARYDTVWGTKTACGLARTALAILFNEG